MDEGRELLAGRLPHAPGGAVGGDELRVRGLQVAQLALEPVVGLVADLRALEDVIEVLVPPDLGPELLDPRCRRGLNGLGPG
jgi:hypothetical protein